jgi:hypothetical protein
MGCMVTQAMWQLRDGLDDQRIVVLFLVGRRDFSVFQIVQTGPETNSALFYFLPARSFLQGKSISGVRLIMCLLPHRAQCLPVCLLPHRVQCLPVCLLPHRVHCLTVCLLPHRVHCLPTSTLLYLCILVLFIFTLSFLRLIPIFKRFSKYFPLWTCVYAAFFTVFHLSLY